MKISKIREVKTPTRGTEFSAGIDFYVPEFNSLFCEDLLAKNNLTVTVDNLFINKSVTLNPQQRLLIPSGIHVNFADGLPRALVNFNKSGKASKFGLDVLACVIDQDYQGEIHLSVNNNSSSPIVIRENEKLIQGLFLLITYESIEEVPFSELYNSVSQRGSGGFGSTGN